MKNHTARLEQLAKTYRVDKDASESELLAASKLYARKIVEIYDLEIVISDLEWDVSNRAKRRAGAIRYNTDGPIGIRLTWEYFEQFGWDEIARTIRHELIHGHLLNTTGDGSHGPSFRELAMKLDVDIHCKQFANPKWTIGCCECDVQIYRYRQCPLVDDASRYRCGNCGGNLKLVFGPPNG